METYRFSLQPWPQPTRLVTWPVVMQQCINCGKVEQGDGYTCSSCHSADLHIFPVEVIRTDDSSIKLRTVKVNRGN